MPLSVSLLKKIDQWQHLFVIILWSQNHLLVIDHRMWEMRLSALLTPWNLPRCSILKASLYLDFSCCWPVWTWKLSFRLLDVHQHTHGQISLVWTSDQVKPAFNFCPAFNIYFTLYSCYIIFILLNFLLGSYGNPSGCNAWGGRGVITMCLGVGLVCQLETSLVPNVKLGG